LSTAHHVCLLVLARNGGDPQAGIHYLELRKITRLLYPGRAANGALFGFRYPWMERRGDLRFFTEHGQRRLGF